MLAAGCAHHVTKPIVSSDETLAPEASNDAEEQGEAVVASALVFQPPIAPSLEPELARAGRDVSAFMGFETAVDEYFYVRVDDRQSDVFQPNYERRAVSVRTGVVQR